MRGDTFLSSSRAGNGEADRPDNSAEGACESGQGDQRCAGINRHGVADERAAQERSSAPSWLRVMRLRPQGMRVKR